MWKQNGTIIKIKIILSDPEMSCTPKLVKSLTFLAAMTKPKRTLKKPNPNKTLCKVGQINLYSPQPVDLLLETYLLQYGSPWKEGGGSD